MDKYLLEILQESNTIIIPGLGALTIVNKDTGETMFMPYLQHDDGKLAAFIAQKDGIDEADAKNIVAKYVREIQAEVDKGESYSMYNLGTFAKKEDGDIVFQNWSKSDQEEVPAAEPVVEEPIVEETHVVDEIPEVEAESDPEPEAESEAEAEVTPESIEEVEAVSEPEPEVEPEPISEPEVTTEPVEEPEAISEPEPEIIPEPIEEVEPPVEIEPEEVSATEITPEPVISEETEEEIREAIAAAMVTTPEPDEIIPDRTTLEPSPLLDDIAPSSAVSLDPDDEMDDENGEGIAEEGEKKKAGVGFWITLILVALAIIGGGAYIGRNYNQIKESLFSENDKETDKKSLKDEMSNVIKEDKYTRPETDRTFDGNSENSSEDGMDNDNTEPVTQPEPEVKKPEVKKPEVKTPEVKKPATVNVSSSSSGPYKVIAGAFSSEANANRLAADYKAKGMNSEVFMKGELYTVSMQSYATSEEANANLSKLQSMAPGAWIYYKR